MATKDSHLNAIFSEVRSQVAQAKRVSLLSGLSAGEWNKRAHDLLNSRVNERAHAEEIIAALCLAAAAYDDEGEADVGGVE